MWKQIISSYFTFTKKERTGTIVLLVLILLCTVLPFLYPFFITTTPADGAAFKKEIESLKIKQPDSTNRFTKSNFDEDNYQNYYQPAEKNYRNKSFKGELFYFDPNTATAADWQRLGVREKTIATIQNYLSK